MSHGWTDPTLGRLVLVVVLLTAGLFACSAPRDATWRHVRETGVLRVGMDASFPPFEAVDVDGSLVGFDVDLTRELARRLDLQPQIVANLPYDGLYDALKARHVDVVISALVVNPHRMADFDYSTSYFDAGQVLVSCKDEESIESVRDLRHCSLAVALGTEGDREARKWTRRLTELRVVHYQTPAEALRALEDGEVDAALVDHVSALQAIGGGDRLTIIGEPVFEVPYALAVRRDSQQLLRAINRVLAEMKVDGTMTGLKNKWFEDQQ